MFSQRIDSLQPSPIRQILSVIDRPGMVSFAGGLPATQMLAQWSGHAGPTELQYGASEGEPQLRALVGAQLRSLGIDAADDRVLILSGSQQGIDLVAKLFIDPGTPVAVEAPTYLAALQVFRLFGGSFEELTWGAAPTARLAYVVPTFANPTGACATAAQRRDLAAACLASGTTLFEDDPYRELAYDPCDRTPVVAGMSGGSWIYQGSFSKTLAPGLRLGYLAASADLFGPLVMLKQAVDLHACRLSQRIVLDSLTDPRRAARLDRLRDFYRERRDGFEAALHRHFDGLATWDRPPGGLFHWLTLARPIDTRDLLGPAIERGVAFMPGEEFFPGRPQLGTLRLNFSHADASDADRGLAILAELLRDTHCRQ